MYKNDYLEITNEDNMELMKRFPDNHFELAIVDPPYGLGKRLAHDGNGKNAQSKFSDDFKKKAWDDDIPSKEYFDELFRVSKEQIIWGGNYFLEYLGASRGMICWDKMVYIPTMSQIEYAWVSFDRLPKLIQINNTDKNRIHLTQKPVKLYGWLLNNYCKKGFKVLDTHLGSGSIAIALHNMNERDGMDLTLTACELDKDYFDASIKRIEQHMAQKTIFSL